MTAIAKPVRKRAALGVRSEKRVREILAVAREVFAEHGYEKSTTLEIARRLGIAEATVFSYFTGKRDLCMQVIKIWYDEISLVLEQDMPLVDGTRARLHFVVHKHLVTLMQDGTGMCKLVLSEGRSADDAFAALIAGLKRRYTAPLMKVLAAAQHAGEVRQDMPLPLLRDMVYGSMEHVLWDTMVNHNPPDIATTAAQLTSMLWTAITPEDPPLARLARFHHDVAQALLQVQDSPAPLP